MPTLAMPGVGQARLDALVEVDEHARRRSFRLSAITNRRTLHILMSLPWLEPVPLTWLSADVRAVLENLTAGTVEIYAGYVRRLITPAVRVEHAYVRRSRWQDAITAASTYGPFCRRSIVTPQLPRNPDGLLFEAKLRGIGVIVETGDAVTTVVQAESWSERQFKPASWAFREYAYAAILAWEVHGAVRQCSGRSLHQITG